MANLWVKLPIHNLFAERNNKSRKMMAFIFVLTACLLYGKLLLPKGQPVFIFNYAPMTIISSSMEPEYPVYSVVVVKKENFSHLKMGDIIVYKANALRGGLAFHRITRITDEGIYAKGDRNNYEDNQLITEDLYVGKGVMHIKFIARYLSLIDSKARFVVIIFFISAVLLFLSVKFLQKY